MRVQVLAIFITAIVAGCGAQPTTLVSGETSKSPGGSWMAPGVSSQDLLYVSNANGLVNVYDFPQHRLVGVLTDFEHPMGECVDAAGNVYITDSRAQSIDEYAHGASKPMRTIAESYNPVACAIDPKTGDLAVANFSQANNLKRHDTYVGGNVAIYAHAKGKPVYYYGGGDEHFSACGYDKFGDLLAADLGPYGSGSYAGEFYYLAARSKQFSPVDLPGSKESRRWGEVFAIDWDGKYWDIDSGALYRYTIDIKPEYVDTIYLSYSGEGLGPVWVYRKNSKAAATEAIGTSGTSESDDSSLAYWAYPTGGAPIFQTSKHLDAPYGVAVSAKQ